MLRAVTAAILVVLAWTTPVSAESATALLGSVPKNAPIVVGVDLPLVRGTKLYNEGYAFLNTMAKPGSVLHLLMSGQAFDLKKDVDAAVVAFASAPASPTSPPPPSMGVVSGRFDVERVRKTVKASFGTFRSRQQGDLTIYSADNADFAFPDPNTLVIADKAYAAATWEAAKGPANGAAADPAMSSVIQLIDTSRGIWIAMNTATLPTPAGVPKTTGAGLAVDLRKGLAINYRSRFTNKQDAQTAKTDFEGLKNGQDDGTLQMFGVKPLVDNMKASVVQDTVLMLDSAINHAQVADMVKKLKALNEQPKAIAPPTGDPGQNPVSPQPVGKGSNADFN